MKLERLNDNQIRCTLSKSDLDKRELKLSELAYGSAKARALFRDLIQQASIELGFETDNIPLMIEAIPISGECLVLVVTKVEDPEELDTRFSRFSNLSEEILGNADYGSDSYDDPDSGESLYDAGGDDFHDEEPLPFNESEGLSLTEDALDLVAPFTQAIARAKEEVLRKRREAAEEKISMQLYLFHDLDRIVELSAFLAPFYTGDSILYKDNANERYYLFLIKGGAENDTFRRASIIASDYGIRHSVSPTTLSYCKEHFDLLFEDDALQTLNQLNG